MTDTLRKVPELSLLSFTKGNQTERAQFVDKLFSGIKDYGFIILTDHNVEDSVIKNGYQAVEDFFALAEEKKKQYVSPQKGGQRGYTPYGAEHAKDNPHMDLKEFYHVGRQVAPDHAFAKYYSDNIWPTEIAGFQNNLQNLYTNLDQTSEHLLDALGLALEVPQSYFRDMIETGNSILRAIHYPPVGEAPPVGSVRAAPHGDINLITILMGATASGLQLLDRDDKWLDIDTKPGQLVVDSGDMLSRITNEIIPSTIHQVINPDESSTARFSMPFFVHPNPDAMLECIPTCVGSGAKYPPISSHKFLMERLEDIGLMEC